MSDLPRRGLGLAGAVLALGMAAAAPAAAHSGLHASEPADGAVLRAPPPAVALAFMEPVRVTSLRLLDEAGLRGVAEVRWYTPFRLCVGRLK